jgi:CheY-like chemotaxis protein
MAKRILLVEDNALNAKLLRTLLRLAGHEVLEVTTGEQALELVRSLRPDLILMDIQLPGIDGLETCRRIRSDPSLATIPVVAVTSYAMPGDEQKALAAGCIGYITKPIDTRTFGQTIGGFFPGP